MAIVTTLQKFIWPATHFLDFSKISVRKQIKLCPFSSLLKLSWFPKFQWIWTIFSKFIFKSATEGREIHMTRLLFRNLVCLSSKGTDSFHVYSLRFHGKSESNCQIMIRRKLLGDEERAKIDALVAVKKSLTKISCIIKRSRRFILRYLALLKIYGKRMGGNKNKKKTRNNHRVFRKKAGKEYC